MVYNKELVATSSLFFVPIYVLYINDKSVPCIFQNLIFLQGYVSMLFWWNPVKGNNIHMIDKVLSRISISSVIMYKIAHIYAHNAIYIAFL